MRVLVLDRGSRFPISPEQMPMMLEQFAEWRDRYRDKMESFEFFITGGGFGVVNVNDERELNQMMLEFPFAFTDELEVHPVVDGDAALKQAREAMAQMMAQMQPA
jgi:hypothetical protein